MYRIKVKIKKASDKAEYQRLRKGIEKYGISKEIYVDCGVCKISRQQEVFRSTMMYLIDNNALVFDGKKILFIKENIPKPIVRNARAKALERFTYYIQNIFDSPDDSTLNDIRKQLYRFETKSSFELENKCCNTFVATVCRYGLFVKGKKYYLPYLVEHYYGKRVYVNISDNNVSVIDGDSGKPILSFIP